MSGIFFRFFRSESSASLLLLAAILSSLAFANSPLGAAFDDVLQLKQAGAFTIQEWINDGLMSFFFLLVGLEVKRAFLVGELSGMKRAAVPVVAALGGCLAPAALFLVFNHGLPTASGWAIPMATDIAFALAVLQLALGRRAGPARVFLSTLAIADDLFAILVIAIFYSQGIDFMFLLASTGLVVLQYLMNRFGVRGIGAYLLSGAVLWYCVHHSGIHPTIAGVLTAFSIPLRTGAANPPLERLEHALLKPVNLLIMPLFALANTNIAISGEALRGLASPLALGIAAGLVIGKPLGILFATFVTVRFRFGFMPAGLGWRRLLGLGILAGIGFTMSIFVTMLAFDSPQQQAQARLAILASSLVAGLLGALVLRRGQRSLGRSTRI